MRERKGEQNKRGNREMKGEGKPEEEGRGKTGDRIGQLAGLQLDTV